MAKFKNSRAVFTDITDTLGDIVNHFIDDFYKEVKRTTPSRGGAAKKGWKKTTKYSIDRPGKTTVIKNDVPYIGILDEGSSKQAPNGMTGPAFNKLSNRRYRKRK